MSYDKREIFAHVRTADLLLNPAINLHFILGQSKENYTVQDRLLFIINHTNTSYESTMKL